MPRTRAATHTLAITDMDATTHPLTDLALARRLERTEAAANAAFVDAHARLDPDVGAAWIEVAGAYAMFDGAASPLTQTFGLGMFDDPDDDVFERIESFFQQHGAPVSHEVAPLIAPSTLHRLNQRGYQPVELSTVLVRPTGIPIHATSSARVRRIAADDITLWARTAGAGWGSESAELAAFIEDFGQIIAHAQGAHCFLAELNGEPVAVGALTLGDDVALLAGASTVPAARRKGAQAALLAARLAFAAEHGFPLAMMVAQPGSGSQRNAERQGFRIAYTRTKWQLSAPRPRGSAG